MTSQAPVEETRTTPDDDALPGSDTESPEAITESGADDTPTGGLTAGAADAAVRGVDEVLGREVRLVTLPPASGEVLSERIEQVRHLARLHHPHLLEVYDVDGLAPDTESTLVLENVPGEPLPLVLRDGPIDEPALARMGAQLASALAHAHAHGVEHGAIGAASILVDRANSDAWLVGLTASLSGPLSIVDVEAEDEDDGDGAARRRDNDVRALAATLAEIVEHAAATEGEADPEAVIRPTTRDHAAPVSPLVAVLRGVDTPTPPSAALLSERLVRVARNGGRVVGEPPSRLVPVVASWSESPAAPDTEIVAASPAVPARGTSGVTPFAVVSQSGRRARRAGVLGAATATLALASGLVIWAGESHIVRPESQAEVGASGPVAAAPAPVGPHFPSFGGLSSGWDHDGSASGTGSGSGSGPDQVVGVASRKAALPGSSSTDPTTSSRGPVIPPTATPPRTGPSQPTDPTSLPPSSRPTTQPPTSTRPTTTRPTSTVPPTTQPSSTPQPTSTQSTPTGGTTTPTGTTTSTPGTTTTGTGTTTPGPDGTTPTTTTTPPTAQVLAAGS